MKNYFTHMGKKALYSIVTIVVIAAVYLGGGAIKNGFFNDEIKAAETLVESIESGAAFTMDFEYYSLGKATGDYTKIAFDGTTYSVDDMYEGDSQSFTCEKGTEDCEDVEEVIQDELGFVKTSFDKTYEQEISSDDNYNYSNGVTEDSRKYQVKVSNDGKTSVDEFNIEKSKGAVITTTVK